MHRVGLFAAVSTLALVAPAHGQNAAPTPAEAEIIVTATKREQSILDVPFSVNA